MRDVVGRRTAPGLALRLRLGGSRERHSRLTTPGVLLVLPFVAFLLIIFFGKRMKFRGPKFAIGAMAINWV